MFENEFDNSFGGGGGFVNSQGNFADKKSARTKQSSRNAPVTVASILEIPPGQETIRIGSEEFNCVTIVGVVRSVSRNGPAIFYEIDDMTGPPITVRQYMNEGDEEPVAMENTYVRVYGALKTFEEKHSLMCYRILPLQDLNESTAHLLEVVQCKLFYTRDALKHVKDRAAGVPVTYGAAMGSTKNAPAHMTSSVPTFGSNSGPMNQVYAYLKHSKADEGVSIRELKSNFKNISEQQLTSYLDFLCGEGQIYTTIDDDHFKVTD